ncbi:hypothetical protein B0T09DRAFT_354175 [Sordaria sp. MPI-SDFR-AT-0083]|nr:hypothetical protein B0T09DRAFT_354175 [Sordaria sp. MPI-SDFR-AT-0083]
MLAFPNHFAWSLVMIYSQSENSVACHGQLWPIFCGFDGSRGFAVLWTGTGLVKRSAYGRMRRRRLEADGDALEMLSIGVQAYLRATTVVHHGCPRVRGRGHWRDGNADGESTDLEPSAEELHYRKVGLLLAGYLMQCHEAYQAPNQHGREEGRRPSNLPGTCPPVRGASWSFGELLGFPNGSALLHTFLWFRDATKCDEIAADFGLGMWSPAMLEKSTSRKERTKLSGRWDSDVQIRQLADW